MKLLFQGLVATAMLTGCSYGLHTRVISGVFGDDGQAPLLMRDKNVVGWVAFDEKHFSKAAGIAKSALYASGVRKESKVMNYRYVPISSPRMENHTGVLWKPPGAQMYVVGAMVPDHIGELKAADIVEWRSISSWDSLVGFDTTGEGQIVTRVLCRKSSPDWKKCHDSLPAFHHLKAAGFTGTPFLPSAKDYGFTFTEFYDESGNLLKPLPPP